MMVLLHHKLIFRKKIVTSKMNIQFYETCKKRQNNRKYWSIFLFFSEICITISCTSFFFSTWKDEKNVCFAFLCNLSITFLFYLFVKTGISKTGTDICGKLLYFEFILSKQIFITRLLSFADMRDVS